MKAQVGNGIKMKGLKPVGTKTMRTNNSTIMPTLRKIDNIEYKGNAVLNANK